MNGKGAEVEAVSWCGTGFTLSKDGRVVTTYSVAKMATHIVVVFEDGSSYAADTLLAWDAERDVAVLKMNANKRFSAPDLADSDSVKVLDTVFAAGNPKCQGLALTEGEVNRLRSSAYGRVQLICHSAATAPGCYGGPLYHGTRVVGIQSYSDFPYEIHYAVPINILKSLIKKTAPAQISTVFSMDRQNLNSKRSHFFSTNGTVAAASEGKPSMETSEVDLPWRHMDIEITVEPNPASDVAIVVTDVEQEPLGYANESGAGKETLYISIDTPQPVAIHVLNLGNSPAQFGLSVFWIRW
jgi:S1-C subfamily serine protease